MLASEWEWGRRGGGWGVSAVRPRAYQCRADTIPMVLADRWGVCVCLLAVVVSEPPGQVLRDEFVFGSRCTSPAPLPPLSPCSLTPPGGIWWEWLERPGAPQGVLLSPVHLFQTGPCGTLGLPWGPCWLGIRPSKRLHFQVDCFVTVLGGLGGHPS